jgi:hypothetical protein
MMLEELQGRNYSENTTRCYIRTVEDFSRYFNCSPDRLGPRHIREYQAALFQKRKFSPNTVAQRLAALRFFYVKTLKKAWSITPHGAMCPSCLVPARLVKELNILSTFTRVYESSTEYIDGLRRFSAWADSVSRHTSNKDVAEGVDNPERCHIAQAHATSRWRKAFDGFRINTLLTVTKQAASFAGPDMIRSYESGNRSALKNLTLHLSNIRSA